MSVFIHSETFPILDCFTVSLHSHDARQFAVACLLELCKALSREKMGIPTGLMGLQCITVYFHCTGPIGIHSLYLDKPQAMSRIPLTVLDCCSLILLSPLATLCVKHDLKALSFDL